MTEFDKNNNKTDKKKTKVSAKEPTKINNPIYQVDNKTIVPSEKDSESKTCKDIEITNKDINESLNELIDTQKSALALKYLYENHESINLCALTIRRKFILIEFFGTFVIDTDIEMHEKIFLIKLLKNFLIQNPELEKLVEYKILLKNLRNKLKNKCDLSKIYRLRGSII
ncbi:hypothetical protein CDIK_2268 [Cucumispora dikerogammari]|nr:hypothetical protein CDIK_2268 [Cucumispora dikerogammari]